MNNADRQYKELLEHIIRFGNKKTGRNGDTLSIFGWQIRHRMSEGFPLLTTKKMYFKGIVTELLWFLRGDTNIKYLIDNDCHIWDGDAYKNYVNKKGSYIYDDGGTNTVYTPLFINGEPVLLSKEEFINKIKTDSKFAKQWGDLGQIYGKQWRNWESIKPTGNNKEEDPSDGTCYWTGYDQIAGLIHTLKTNPDDRRMMVNAWNVGEIDQMVLPPCHYGFQVYTRELTESERFSWYGNKIGSYMHHDHIEQEMNQQCVPKRAISLAWNQRSVDTFLGLPFNIASYALLLEIIAKEVNMVPEEVIGSLGDTHLYVEHIDAAKEQMSRKPFELPKLKLGHFGSILDNISVVDVSDFELENHQSHPAIKAILKN
jgi:thymidylate synthase